MMLGPILSLTSVEVDPGSTRQCDAAGIQSVTYGLLGAKFSDVLGEGATVALERGLGRMGEVRGLPAQASRGLLGVQREGEEDQDASRDFQGYAS